MAADDFFSRWGKQKSADPAVHAESPPASALPLDQIDSSVSEPSEPVAPPTLDDVAQLTPDSDFSRFVGKDVDENVKRSAMKKLFSNPHFNVMDRLDVYIDDYNQFTPLTPAMLASLNHAKDLLKPLLTQEEEQAVGQESPAESVASAAVQSDTVSMNEAGKGANLSDDDEPGAIKEEIYGSKEIKNMPAAWGDIQEAGANQRDKPLSKGA